MLALFSKYTGCGNDFILFDNRLGSFPIQQPGLVSRLCHRQQGIGADGVILLENSDTADFRMRIYNADGTEAEMCGNGIRCLMKFIHELGFKEPVCTIETMQRKLKLLMDEDQVSVEMGTPTDIRWDINLKIESESMTLQYLNTGVPHAILFVEELDAFDLAYWGPKIRHHPLFGFPGTNFNVATYPKNGRIAIRTYERGVEGETLACGTGATAAALAAAKLCKLKGPIKVVTRLNEILEIAFQQKNCLFSDVTMTGPSKRVYRGEVDISVITS